MSLLLGDQPLPAGLAGLELDENNKLKVSLPMSAFGEVLVAHMIPVIQAKTVYHVSDRVFEKVATGSAAIGYDTHRAKLSTGTTTGSVATLNTRRMVAYRPGQGTAFRWTMLFETGGVAGTQQMGGGGTTEQGLFFGFNGEDFGIMRMFDSTPHWTTQADWNVDKMDGTGPSGKTLRPQFGNVFQIAYQHLGFGAMFFSIENKDSGEYQLVHVIRYNGTSEYTSVGNPSFPLCIMADNGSTTTDLVMYAPSFAAFIQGEERLLGPHFTEIADTTVSTTAQVLLAIRNEATFQGQTNRVLIHPAAMTLTNDDNRQAIFEIYLVQNAAFTAGTFNPVDADSCASFYLTGVGTAPAYTSAVLGFATAVGRQSHEVMDRSLAIDVGADQLPPGTTLVVTARATATNANVTVSITWEENQ